MFLRYEVSLAFAHPHLPGRLADLASLLAGVRWSDPLPLRDPSGRAPLPTRETMRPVPRRSAVASLLALIVAFHWGHFYHDSPAVPAFGTELKTASYGDES